jgi:hypothetical protein
MTTHLRKRASPLRLLTQRLELGLIGIALDFSSNCDAREIRVPLCSVDEDGWVELGCDVDLELAEFDAEVFVCCLLLPNCLTWNLHNDNSAMELLTFGDEACGYLVARRKTSQRVSKRARCAVLTTESGVL